MKAKDFTTIQAQIWFELDQAKCAIPKETLCERINCSVAQFDDEKKALLRSGDLYFSFYGYVLKEYASYDEQLWHLSWSLGLLETSAINVGLDRDLIQLAPSAINVLINQGKMDKDNAHKLSELRAKIMAMKEIPQLLLKIYNEVEELLSKKMEKTKELEGKKEPIKDFKDLKKRLKK